MEHVKETLLVGAFVYIFYSAIDWAAGKQPMLSRVPYYVKGFVSAVLALAFVKGFLLPI